MLNSIIIAIFACVAAIITAIYTRKAYFTLNANSLNDHLQEMLNGFLKYKEEIEKVMLMFEY
ncbi:hypothetical protein QI117_11400 [Staphylococcus saprophyticus]|uniref:hypothetical protein n=1 Tax=Staphylococcus saprophyticus TaxID=29385 RepID=UPI00076B8A12|nr:hypothetical protein [Staphylococcus saprophyticus]AMG19203.1 hypothetical protein AL528_02780 [Staphylococcus saprophyticus]MDW3785296.1 hypothetical protein [Staphylococcus saprophyticus]MDW3860323.1 hypothetical protein [Staphylococcus saprophyticus]MDW3940499.1 hypothetical protein [Staphylococcus saprophyticus]MDW3987798.1 hypothetical protein [Staphylococcus saprophyticus]